MLDFGEEAEQGALFGGGEGGADHLAIAERLMVTSGSMTSLLDNLANLIRTADLLLGLHNRHTASEYQLSPSARSVLAVVEGADQPLEPSVIAERRGLIRRLPHPGDRRKILIDITHPTPKPSSA